MEASYLDLGLATDSRDGGPEESVLELVKLQDGMGLTGRYRREGPAKALWPKFGASKGVNSLWMGAWVSSSCPT